MTCGERISELRLKKGLTQEELANRVGITRAALSHYEKDRREPDFETLQKLAHFFDVTTDYILSGKNKTTSNIDPDLDEHARELQELFKDDPDSSSFWYEFKEADEETRRKMIETWKFINELEKNRKPGDKQGK